MFLTGRRLRPTWLRALHTRKSWRGHPRRMRHRPRMRRRDAWMPRLRNSLVASGGEPPGRLTCRYRRRDDRPGASRYRHFGSCRLRRLRRHLRRQIGKFHDCASYGDDHRGLSRAEACQEAAGSAVLAGAASRDDLRHGDAAWPRNTRREGDRPRQTSRGQQRTLPRHAQTPPRRQSLHGRRSTPGPPNATPACSRGSAGPTATATAGLRAR